MHSGFRVYVSRFLTNPRILLIPDPKSENPMVIAAGESFDDAKQNSCRKHSIGVAAFSA